MDELADFKFDWIENSVVVAMLLLSFFIGVYYTFCNKQETFSEYMLGGRSMGIFPVAMSLVARKLKDFKGYWYKILSSKLALVIYPERQHHLLSYAIERRIRNLPVKFND